MPAERFTENVACPVCDSVEHRVLAQAAYPERIDPAGLQEMYRSSSDVRRMDRLVECAGCGLVFLNPRVRSDLVVHAYAEGDDPAFVSQNPLRLRTFRRHLGRLVETYDLAPGPGTRLLDVGCAGGAFVAAAAGMGFDAIGVEPNRWLCEHGRREYGIDLRPGLLEDQGFPDASFDVVTMWDVLEHVPHPAAVLEEIHRVIRPGGWLFVNFPDYSSLPRKVLGERWPFMLNVHLTYFTPRTLGRLLRRTGFEGSRARPFWQTLELGYVFQRAADTFGSFAVLERAVKRLGMAGIPIRYYAGQTLVAARADHSSLQAGAR